MRLHPRTLLIFFITVALAGCSGNNAATSNQAEIGALPSEKQDKGVEAALSRLERSTTSTRQTTAIQSSPITNTIASTKQCLSPTEQQVWQRPPLQDRIDPFGEFISKSTALVAAPAAILATTVDRFSSTVSPQEAKPICGNWCGAHRMLKGDDPQAVDELDEACRQHDMCYRKLGRYQCGCDQQLLTNILRGRQSVSLGGNEQMVFLYYQGSPCTGGCKRVNDVQICGTFSQR